MGVVRGILSCGIVLAMMVLVGMTTQSWAGSGPPPGLSVTAETYWNIDALVHDTFGNVRVCLHDSYVVTRAAAGFCPAYYVSLFPSARSSSFSLVARVRNPLEGLNVMPVRFKSRSGPYVSCGGGRWLAMTNGRTQLWPVGCIRR